MYVPLAPGREIVFGEGLLKVIPPSRQVRVCVCLNIPERTGHKLNQYQ